MKSLVNITNMLDRILQRDIEIVCDKKVIRKGTFILYTVKDYVLTMIIKTPTNNKSYDIYYPFAVDMTDDVITFDYTIDKIQCEKSDNIIDLDSGSCNKFLNKKLKIKYI